MWMCKIWVKLKKRAFDQLSFPVETPTVLLSIAIMLSIEGTTLGQTLSVKHSGKFTKCDYFGFVLICCMVSNTFGNWKAGQWTSAGLEVHLRTVLANTQAVLAASLGRTSCGGNYLHRDSCNYVKRAQSIIYVLCPQLDLSMRDLKPN